MFVRTKSTPPTSIYPERNERAWRIEVTVPVLACTPRGPYAYDYSNPIMGIASWKIDTVAYRALNPPPFVWKKLYETRIQAGLCGFDVSERDVPARCKQRRSRWRCVHRSTRASCTAPPWPRGSAWRRSTSRLSASRTWRPAARGSTVLCFGLGGGGRGRHRAQAQSTGTDKKGGGKRRDRLWTSRQICVTHTIINMIICTPSLFLWLLPI